MEGAKVSRKEGLLQENVSFYGPLFSCATSRRLAAGLFPRTGLREPQDVLIAEPAQEVFASVAHMSDGIMKLPPVTLLSGQHLRHNDVALSCHQVLARTESRVILRSQPILLDVEHHSRIAVLSSMLAKNVEEFWSMIRACRSWNKVRTDFSLPTDVEDGCNIDRLAELVTGMLRSGAYKDPLTGHLHGHVHLAEPSFAVELRALRDRGWLEAFAQGWLLTAAGESSLAQNNGVKYVTD